jgi:hypothetical protein
MFAACSKILCASLSICATILVVGGSAFGAEGTVIAPTANATWTLGHVQNLSVTMQACGEDGVPTCSWAGIAGVMAAALGNCPHDWDTPGVEVIWASVEQTQNGTTESGPRSFSLNGAAGQRLCLYLERRFPPTVATATVLLYQPLLELMQPPAPLATPSTPQAAPPPPLAQPNPPPATALRPAAIPKKKKPVKCRVARHGKKHRRICTKKKPR